jgi:hypothetical protein
MDPIVSKVDLEAACSQSRAFVFLWVCWSGQARHSEVAVNKLLKAWTNESLDTDAQAYRADISEPESESWSTIDQWLRAQQQRLTDFGGNGELLWVRSGKVVAVAANVARFEHDELMAMTRNAFGAGIN